MSLVPCPNITFHAPPPELVTHGEKFTQKPRVIGKCVTPNVSNETIQ